MAETIGIIFVTQKPEGCRMVCIKTIRRPDEPSREDSYKRLLSGLARHIPSGIKQSTFCHGGESTLAIYELPPGLSSCFGEHLWQHPTIACTDIGVPDSVKRLILKVH